MKTILVALSTITFIVAGGISDGADVPLPSRSQSEWLKAGIGIFVHWAPNVYQAAEGDNLSTPREKINPDRFDAAKIVEAAKSAKAGYIIFVAKHVGGYCAWQTETTDYSLKTSPWKNGKGDMVGDLANACRQQGLRFGVYLSPRSDIHGVGTGGQAGDAKKQKAYNEIYYMSIGRGVNLLLNITPDDHGAIPLAQVSRLKEFGDEIDARFARPLATAKGTGDTLELKFAAETTVDHLQLAEDIRQGERVRQFQVERRAADGTWSTVVRGTQIGARQFFPIPAIKANGLRLKVERSVGEPVIAQFAAFHVDRPVPKAAYREK